MTDASESIDLQEGLRQSAAGETVSLGSFAKYADDIDLAELERLAKAAQEAIRLHGGLVPTSIYKFQDATDPATIIRLVARVREAEARVERFDAVGAYAALREELSRERRAHTVTLQRLRKAEARIEKVLNHDPLHGAESGLHCGGMSPCIRRILTEGDEQ